MCVLNWDTDVDALQFDVARKIYENSLVQAIMTENVLPKYNVREQNFLTHT